MAVFGNNWDFGISPRFKDEGDFDDPTVYLDWKYLPNWKFPIRTSYNFITPISLTRRNHEQRKALWDKPIREINFVVTENIIFQYIWHHLQYIRDKSAIIPIYTEPCRPSGDGSLIGLNVIPIINDMTYYYNLKNLATHVCLIDFSRVLDAELYELSGSVGGNITLASNITGNFQASATVIFPVFTGYLLKVTKNDITDTYTKYNLEFTEYY